MSNPLDRGGRVIDGGPGFVERMAASLRFAFTGDTKAWAGWFGPGTPLPPIAPGETEGRQFDYPTSLNIHARPRSLEAVGFDQLRLLADNYDLLRLVIETRKDQLDKLEWVIRPKKTLAGGKVTDSRAIQLTEFFYFPDKLHTWSQWLRAIMEDLLVIDAPTVYCRRTKGGDPFAIEPIDGSTIFRLVDDSGRTPLEGAAYQQILKGVKACDYTRDELIYLPRNVRTNKLYGYSPVEQVLMTVNIAIRRQVSQLQYYTHGNTPDLIIGLPKEWQPAAVRQFSEWWNSLMSSEDQSERRKTRFVPEGLKVIDTKEKALKDEYDEWLARVICYAFSVSPQALVQQMNRATAQTAMEQALQEGLQPLMKWFKAFIDSILIRFFGETEYEFAWVEDKAVNPLEQAQIQEIHVRSQIRTVDEIREKDLKLEPLKKEGEENPAVAAGGGSSVSMQDTALNGAQIASLLSITDAVGTGKLPKDSAKIIIREAFPQIEEDAANKIIEPIEVKEPEPPPIPPQGAAQFGGKPAADGKAPAPVQEPNTEAGKAPAVPKQPASEPKPVPPAPPTKKLAKAASVTMDRPFALATEKKLRAAWKKWMRSQINPLSSQITEAIGKVSKADSIEEQVEALLKQLGFKNEAMIRKTTQDLLAAMYKDAGYEALQKIARNNARLDDMLSVVNERAAAWAKEQAGTKIDDIIASSRDMLKSTVVQAINEGLSTQEVADLLSDAYAFGDERASTIARTELATANVQGNLDGYRESGVVEKLEWLVSQDEVCDECEEMGKLEGDLEKGFSGGEDDAPAVFPPLHPNCRCDIIPVVIEVPSTPEEREEQ